MESINDDECDILSEDWRFRKWEKMLFSLYLIYSDGALTKGSPSNGSLRSYENSLYEARDIISSTSFFVSYYFYVGIRSMKCSVVCALILFCFFLWSIISGIFGNNDSDPSVYTSSRCYSEDVEWIFKLLKLDTVLFVLINFFLALISISVFN